MRELIIAGCLFSLLVGGGLLKKKYEKRQMRDECAHLGYLLDTGQYDQAHWYMTRETEFLRRGDPEEVRLSCV